MATFEELMREAQKFFDVRDYNTAEIIYSEIISMDANSKDAYFQRAEIYDLFEDYEKSLADYNKALEFEQNENYYYGRGRIYAKLKQFEKTLTDYTRAIRSAEFEHAELYNERGWTYIKLENVKRAVFDFNKAIEVAPNDSVGYNGRGRIFEELGEREKARADFRTAESLGYEK